MNSNTLMQASRQWATRPADERFTSLPDMLARLEYVRGHSRALVVSSRALQVQPANGDQRDGLEIVGANGHAYAPTHWAFGQLAQLSEAPAGYLRTLPAPIAADCMNFGLRFKRGPEDVGILLYKDGTAQLRCATGPAYGRIWNADIVRELIGHVGDGVSGDWRVPGEFGKAVTVDKNNTTLYASDRDMFVFLADEQRRIEVPNRRNGSSGSLARGFFMWNSETGKSRFGLATFLFDYACSNRIVWGAEGYKEISIIHRASAPDRWVEEVQPALIEYARSSDAVVVDTIAAAQAKRVDDVEAFLRSRFANKTAEAIQAAHMTDEGRPIETLWDATTAVTAYARSLPHQDARVEVEREGGKILALATA